MLWYMKHCNYEKLKPTLIKAGMSHIRNESAEEIAYAQDMFETIFKDFKQEKDVHISGLLADLMNQKPVTAEDFAALEGRYSSSCRIRTSSPGRCRRISYG